MPIRVSLPRILGEVAELLGRHPIDPQFNQLSLTHRPAAENPFLDGLGSLYDFETQKFLFTESEFKVINSELDGTLLAQLIEHVKSWSPLQVGRVRLMRLPAKGCLSYHRDENLRYHLPLITNPKALFFIEGQNPFHMPANGQLYWMDTRKMHTAMNGHDQEERVHLVFSTACERESEYSDFVNKFSPKEAPSV